jgi:hypothetical protein
VTVAFAAALFVVWRAARRRQGVHGAAVEDLAGLETS